MSEMISTEAASNKCQQPISHKRRFFKGLFCYPPQWTSPGCTQGKQSENLHSSENHCAYTTQQKCIECLLQRRPHLLFPIHLTMKTLETDNVGIYCISHISKKLREWDPLHCFIRSWACPPQLTVTINLSESEIILEQKVSNDHSISHRTNNPRGVIP